MRYRLGADIGGTFTDIILLGPDGAVYSRKVLSTPDDYSRAIQEGTRVLLDSLGIAGSDVREVAHGTTVATNAIIERKGVKVGLVTTKGFRDVLEIGRFRVPKLYDMSFRKPEPLVERRLRFGVPERIGADGTELLPLDTGAIDEAIAAFEAEDVKAVAVCFMNSYVDGVHEREAATYLRERLPGIAVTASTEIVPQIQEYERTSTTVVNAYVRPVVERYLTSLEERLRALGIEVPLLIMQSSGGVLPAEVAARNPVFIIESGPAAGVVGAQRLGERIGEPDMIVLDMGGTTAKASLIEDGQYVLTPEIEVGGMQTGQRLIRGAGYIVQFPTIDIAEVGAGGGSIAWVDPGGGLRVGPQSAGAAPGPVCYGGGGTEPTVTDANLVLGYLNPGALVGGELSLDYAGAERALAALGERLGMDVTTVAWGIHRIANANMMRALTGVSTERGRDPRQFTLLAIGGNGGVHSPGLAEELGISRVIVPPVSGLFSALGLIFADVEHQSIGAFYRRYTDVAAEDMNAALRPLVAEVEALLTAEGFDTPAKRTITVFTELQYAAQASALTVPMRSWPIDAAAFDALPGDFHAEHERNYGYRSEEERLQLVALKVVGRGVSDEARVPERIERRGESISAEGSRRAWFGDTHGWQEARLMPRGALGETPTAGPVIIEEYDCTTVVPPGWTVHRDAWNDIVLTRDATGNAGD